MSEYWLYKLNEQTLNLNSVTVNGVDFCSTSYYSGHPIPGFNVPCQIRGSILELDEDKVLGIKIKVGDCRIAKHGQVDNAFQIIEAPGFIALNGQKLGDILVLMPLADALARGYLFIGSPEPRSSDRLSAVTG